MSNVEEVDEVDIEVVDAMQAKIDRYVVKVTMAIEQVNGSEYTDEFTTDDWRLVEAVAKYFIAAHMNPSEFGLQADGKCPAMFAFDVLRVLTNEMELNLPT